MFKLTPENSTDVGFSRPKIRRDWAARHPGVI
jgi:hypothetical protein